MGPVDRFTQRLAAPPPPPREVTLEFVRGHLADGETLDDLQVAIRRGVAVNPRPYLQARDGLSAYLALDLPEGELAHLVAWEANRALHDPTDVGARRFLAAVLELLRAGLA
ncbi:MAG: hypothetical protein ABMA64_19390 [Myxococcota bacterium]